MNFDPDVQWWARIYDNSGAKIAYTPRHYYVPDFVVLDKNGFYWIIEAKRESDRNDEIVEAKRKATEFVLRKTVELTEYEDQLWAYMISFEDDIRNADSFADLIARCEVESSLPM